MTWPIERIGTSTKGGRHRQSCSNGTINVTADQKSEKMLHSKRTGTEVWRGFNAFVIKSPIWTKKSELLFCLYNCVVIPLSNANDFNYFDSTLMLRLFQCKLVFVVKWFQRKVIFQKYFSVFGAYRKLHIFFFYIFIQSY
jgi:hypothetical protein